MIVDAMEPHGLAMRAYFQGETDAQLFIRRDDGLDTWHDACIDPSFLKDNVPTSPLGVDRVATWKTNHQPDNLWMENVAVWIRMRPSDDGGGTWGSWVESVSTFFVANVTGRRSNQS